MGFIQCHILQLMTRFGRLMIDFPCLIHFPQNRFEIFPNIALQMHKPPFTNLKINQMKNIYLILLYAVISSFQDIKKPPHYQ
jgi:hypothetical protein